MTIVFHLRKLFTFLFLLGASGFASGQKFKVATVDFNYLIAQYYIYEQAVEERKFEEEAIQEEAFERQKRIDALGAELDRMVKEIQDPTISAARKQVVRQQAQVKEADLKALVREKTVYLETSQKALLLKMNSLQEEINNTIGEAIQEYAETQDVDFVFDGTGVSTQRVPFLLYVRNPVDLTDPVLEIINKDAPRKPENDNPPKEDNK